MAKRKNIQSFTHNDAVRKNIPTAELESVVGEQQQQPIPVNYKRGSNTLQDEKANRNRDLDPQLAWRGKDEQDWSDLVVHAPPLYIQEKIHPKVLIDDLVRRSRRHEQAEAEENEPTLFPDLFADFNGLSDNAHLPRGARSRTSQNNGRSLSVLSARRFKRRCHQGSRSYTHRPARRCRITPLHE